MKPRTVVVTMTIPDCTLPARILRSKRWILCGEVVSTSIIAAIILEERPKVNTLRKRSGKAVRK